jgi:hypothetical protein
VFHDFAAAAFVVSMIAGFARAEDVDGFGRTVEDAKRDARLHALQELQARLNLSEALTPWQPTSADVEGMLENPGRAGAAFDVKGLGVQYRWVLPVRFPSPEEVDRRALAARRQFAAGSMIVVAVAGLSAWWGWKRVRSKLVRTVL